MMEEYLFTETSSRNVTENGETVRLVMYRGQDQNRITNNYLNVDGAFTMPLMDYFMAGMENRLSEIIKEHVLSKIVIRDGEEDTGEAPATDGE